MKAYSLDMDESIDEFLQQYRLEELFLMKYNGEELDKDYSEIFAVHQLRRNFITKVDKAYSVCSGTGGYTYCGDSNGNINVTVFGYFSLPDYVKYLDILSGGFNKTFMWLMAYEKMDVIRKTPTKIALEAKDRTRQKEIFLVPIIQKSITSLHKESYTVGEIDRFADIMFDFCKEKGIDIANSPTPASAVNKFVTEKHDSEIADNREIFEYATMSEKEFEALKSSDVLNPVLDTKEVEEKDNGQFFDMGDNVPDFDNDAPQTDALVIEQGMNDNDFDFDFGGMDMSDNDTYEEQPHIFISNDGYIVGNDKGVQKAINDKLATTDGKQVHADATSIDETTKDVTRVGGNVKLYVGSGYSTIEQETGKSEVTGKPIEQNSRDDDFNFDFDL